MSAIHRTEIAPDLIRIYVEVFTDYIWEGLRSHDLSSDWGISAPPTHYRYDPLLLYA